MISRPSVVSASLPALGSLSQGALPPAVIVSPVSDIINHPVVPDMDGFYDLEEFLGVVMAALRVQCLDSDLASVPESFSFVLAKGGITRLSEELLSQGFAVNRARISDDIYQTDDPHRSIVEQICNSFDAKAQCVHVTLEDGETLVEDDGCGMSPLEVLINLLIPKLSGKPDPTRQIGRFGVGFYTTLRHLQQEGDRAFVATCQGGAYITWGEGFCQIYLSFNPGLEKLVAEWQELSANPAVEDYEKRWRRLRANVIQTMTHEVTHHLTEQPDTPGFTHGLSFYRAQRMILMDSALN